METQQLECSISEYLGATDRPTYLDFVKKYKSQIAAWAEEAFQKSKDDTSMLHGRLWDLYRVTAAPSKVVLGTSSRQCITELRTALAENKQATNTCRMKISRSILKKSNLGDVGRNLTIASGEGSEIIVSKKRKTRTKEESLDPDEEENNEAEGTEAALAVSDLQHLVKLIPEYMKKIRDMTESSFDCYSQLGRHMLQLGKWAVVDAALAGLDFKIRGVDYSVAAKIVPTISSSCVDDLAPFLLLNDGRTALADLVSERKINCNAKSVLPFSWWPWGSKSPAMAISAEIVASVLTALHGNETASAGRALEVEAQTKFLVTRIIHDTVTLSLTRDLVSVFEYNHTFEGGEKTGFRRSDLTVAAQGGMGQKFGVLVTEFERASSGVHKDFEVCTAEAVLELTRLLTTSAVEGDLENTRVHRGLVSGSSIELSCIAPVRRPGGIVYVVDRRGPKLDLWKGTTKDRVFSALQLVEYIRSVVIPDGVAISEIINRQGGGPCANLIKDLPELPSKAPCPRIAKSEFTPALKRVRLDLAGI